MPALPYFTFKDAGLQSDLERRITSATSENERDRFQRVRCPKCEWRPRASDRWQCTCFHVWNTFHTNGVCPSCSFRWAWTECLSCHQRSAHQDWYVDEPAPAQ
jgi:hypothetical protein